MEYQQIIELMKEVSKAGLSNFEFSQGDVRLAMSYQNKEEKVMVPIDKAAIENVENTPIADVATRVETTKKESTPDATSGGDKIEKEGNIVVSPLVGTFYCAPSQDAQPFVKVGDTVKKGDIIAIVEAMKLMNEIESDYDGIVTEILVKNEDNVEYGQPLFRIQ